MSLCGHGSIVRGVVTSKEGLPSGGSEHQAGEWKAKAPKNCSAQQDLPEGARQRRRWRNAGLVEMEVLVADGRWWPHWVGKPCFSKQKVPQWVGKTMFCHLEQMSDGLMACKTSPMFWPTPMQRRTLWKSSCVRGRQLWCSPSLTRKWKRRNVCRGKDVLLPSQRRSETVKGDEQLQQQLQERQLLGPRRPH